MPLTARKLQIRAATAATPSMRALETPQPQALRDESYKVRIWPEDDPVDVVIDESMVVVGDFLLVCVCDVDDPDLLVAMVALDAHTLAPRGLVRPPVEDVTELTHVDGDRFVARDGAEPRALTFVPATPEG